ncbi:MAG: hypothetical protein ACJAVI_002714 [Candidatus Azotimanducaceae bacterium]|jgi:hypothetical protein
MKRQRSISDFHHITPYVRAKKHLSHPRVELTKMPSRDHLEQGTPALVLMR